MVVKRALAGLVLIVGFGLGCFGQAADVSAEAAAAFAPLQQWKSAVASSDAPALKMLYSSDPPAHIVTTSGDSDVASDVAFWTGLGAHEVRLEMVQFSAPQPALRQVIFQTQFRSPAVFGGHVSYVAEAQLWQQQNGQWKLVAAQHGNPARLEQPVSLNKEIYPEEADAHAQIRDALARAKQGHKRVILVFGANWCFDCHVLDLAFHRPDIAPLVEHGFEVVHVDVGRGDKNQDLMNQYDVPMKRGIPGLAVLESNGKLLYSQTQGQFENARALSPEDLLQFLRKWSPKAE